MKCTLQLLKSYSIKRRRILYLIVAFVLMCQAFLHARRYRLLFVSHDRPYLITWYKMPRWMEINQNVLYNSTCPVHNCIVSSFDEGTPVSDVVIYSAETLPLTCQILKQYWQYWVFFTMESPYLTKPVSNSWNDKFDWTMSYRYDSDFTMGYGKILKRVLPLKRNYSETFRQKSKDVAWAASNCKTASKRGKYIKELQKHIQVDTYGKCGTTQCGKSSAGVTNCHYKFAKEYKFYLAFENSVCRDYTTEKLFNFFQFGLAMIPVVMGNINIRSYIPAGTYIDALEYKTPRDLALALREIGSNESLYTSYLRERDQYTSVKYQWQDVMCPLCLRMNERNGAVIPGIRNVTDWMWRNACTNFS